MTFDNNDVLMQLYRFTFIALTVHNLFFNGYTEHGSTMNLFLLFLIIFNIYLHLAVKWL
jgi:hypothetical protein